MLEPIFAQLQHQILQSLLADLRDLLTSSSGGGNAGRLQAHPSAFDDALKAAAERYGLDPALLKAMAHAESNFSPLAVSHAGAKGIMQLMDATARQLGVKDSFDPAQNIDGGARFLRQLLDRYDGNELLAVAAYNAGPGAIERWGGLPPYSETRAYVPRVMDLQEQYRGWSA
jgi:soluble lytic murein transglycosylase-like protein